MPGIEKRLVRYPQLYQQDRVRPRVPDAADAAQVREIYAGLRMALMRSIGRRDACRDGTPACREDDGRCHYRGLAAAEHDEPGKAGPLNSRPPCTSS